MFKKNKAESMKKGHSRVWLVPPLEKSGEVGSSAASPPSSSGVPVTKPRFKHLLSRLWCGWKAVRDSLLSKTTTKHHRVCTCIPKNRHDDRKHYCAVVPNRPLYLDLTDQGKWQSRYGGKKCKICEGDLANCHCVE